MFEMLKKYFRSWNETPADFAKRQYKEHGIRYVIFCILWWIFTMTLFFMYQNTPDENACNSSNCCSKVVIEKSCEQGCCKH